MQVFLRRAGACAAGRIDYIIIARAQHYSSGISCLRACAQTLSSLSTNTRTFMRGAFMRQYIYVVYQDISTEIRAACAQQHFTLLIYAARAHSRHVSSSRQNITEYWNIDAASSRHGAGALYRITALSPSENTHAKTNIRE